MFAITNQLTQIATYNFQYSSQILNFSFANVSKSKLLKCRLTQANKTSLPTRERNISLWVEGESNNNIATRFGITRHTVSNNCGKYDGKRPSTGYKTRREA